MLNAFALPGGFIGVHTGLVLAAQTESELAGVMAHEIGHVTQRHIARMLAKQRESAALALGALLLALLASRAGGSSSGDMAQAAIVGTQAAMIQQQLNFSREAEREADRVGFQTLTDGGFDSRGMEGFFGRLQSGTRIYESAAPAYLRTHPMTVERISDMQNRTRNLRVKQRADSLDFQLIRARLRVLQETTTQGWRDALEYFNGQLKNQTTASEIAARYGIAVAALKLNQPDLAVQAAQAARRLSPAPSPVLDKVVAEARLVAARTPEERAAAVKMASDNANRYPLSIARGQPLSGRVESDQSTRRGDRFLAQAGSDFSDTARVPRLAGPFICGAESPLAATSVNRRDVRAAGCSASRGQSA